MSRSAIKNLFLVAAVYDFGLGLGYALFFRTIYQWFGIEPPNHAAYVQLPALLIAIFGIGFFFVYLQPEQNGNIVLLGILMKVGFSGVGFYHWFFQSIPVMYVVFAILDTAFAALFVAAYLALRKSNGPIIS